MQYMFNMHFDIVVTTVISLMSKNIYHGLFAPWLYMVKLRGFPHGLNLGSLSQAGAEIVELTILFICGSTCHMKH